jgi:hypothetical protein
MRAIPVYCIHLFKFLVKLFLLGDHLCYRIMSSLVYQKPFCFFVQIWEGFHNLRSLSYH